MIDKKAAFLQLANSTIADPSMDTEDKVRKIFSTAQFFFGSDPDSTKYEWETVMDDITRAIGGKYGN